MDNPGMGIGPRRRAIVEPEPILSVLEPVSTGIRTAKTRQVWKPVRYTLAGGGCSMGLQPLKPRKPAPLPPHRTQLKGLCTPIPRTPKTGMKTKVTRGVLDLTKAPVTVIPNTPYRTLANQLRRKAYGGRIIGSLSRKGVEVW